MTDIWLDITQTSFIMKSFIHIIIGLMILMISASNYAQDIENQIVVEKRFNSKQQLNKPYVILISADGFRYDYIEKYNAEFLKRISKKGVRSLALIPSFPSVTFPNHYSIVTGLYPSHHGLVGNNMIDVKSGERYSLRNKKAIVNPKWYGGTPIWVLAEQNNMLTACYYWPGSEAPIKGFLPTYFYKYSETTPIDDRINEVKEWLLLPEDRRPHLITFYMPEVDHAGHTYGPDSSETETAVRFVDESLKKLNEVVSKLDLPVYFVFVSDHGMNAVDQANPIIFPIKVDENKVDIVSNGTYISVFVKDKKDVLSFYNLIKSGQNNQFEVYLKENIPSHLHFDAKEDRYARIGDIVLLAKAPYLFSNGKPIPGAHGYDPYEVENMNATFLVWGNSVKPKIIDKVENIHIYPLLAKMLGLEVNEQIDGDERLIDLIL
ncbi:Predicted pyrophosphatase or phosphodiesterase, AlkP superfamily [Myroides guanonis]|uniref:Predicted pyrophosphatase or phosphodiesterase, AlkP superfamily n=2 Tax=Myroides guanonis TaxID=1150112 RepID=A0A1I3TRT2_9FLAO|nr:Predicted pyrophosphatase or phosphodiesterase, AlkP superfamily [Myroides guanonis]